LRLPRRNFVHNGSIKLGQLIHFFEKTISSFSLFRIHGANGKTDVDENIISNLGFGNIIESGFADDAAELDSGHAEAIFIEFLENLSGDGKTHGLMLRYLFTAEDAEKHSD
jgi:hypothetical protein